METITLDAQIRKESKKGASRRLRAMGHTPAIVYGYHKEPVMVSVNSVELRRIVEKASKESLFVKLQIGDGKKKTERLSIVKDVQINTIRKSLDHADFYEIRMDKELAIDVPVYVTGDAPGVDKGGELNMVKRQLKLSGLPSLLPEMVEIDVSHLDIGESVKVGDIQLKDGIVSLDPEDVIIASVVMTRAAMAEAGAMGKDVKEEEIPEEVPAESGTISEGVSEEG